MKMTIIVLALLSFATPSKAEWTKIGPGPSYDVADAYCDMAAEGMPVPGYIAIGPPLQVGMGGFGHGLGVMMRRAKYKKNCMVLNGWKNMPASRKKKKKQ